ncbi:MAG TPA: redoxin domain-containing protein [Candidatus Binatus sp.]|nr:redoxin domain-containing protein [Candidatus Binatus sp.]
MATSEPVDPHANEEIGPEFDDEHWVTPPFQPLRAVAAIGLIASGFGLYGYVLASFWSVPWMGIHARIPWPAFAIIAIALVLSAAGLRLALSLASPHAKLGFGLLAFFACLVVGAGGGRFVSYAMRVTVNPPFTLKLGIGQKLPNFVLKDQNGIYRVAIFDAPATVLVVYRGDFDPFARFELAELTAHADEFHKDGVSIVAISADPVDRSKILAPFLNTKIPLLSDDHESMLGALGLVQHHRNGEPDNAIPAYLVVDRNGVIRWIFTSQYYRESPWPQTLLDAAKSLIAAESSKPPAPPSSPQ